MLVHNSPAVRGELNDPGAFAADVDALASLDVPTLVTTGDQSPAMFDAIAESLVRLNPRIRRHTFPTFPGAGYVPHLTHRDDFVAVVVEFLRQVRR